MAVQKQIFVASSKEAKDRFVGRLVDLLSTSFVPVPWWKAFTLGEYTFEDLARNSRSADGAIIVAASDDQVWYRDQLDKRPRDNVIFEFGLFASRLGLRRTIILAEAGVQLPSDLLGVTFLRVQESIEETAKEIRQHFLKEFERDRSIKERPLRAVCHPKIASYQVDIDNIPRQWLMRSLYLGTDGARAWLETVNDPQYENTAERESFLGHTLRMLDAVGSKFRTYVSLGPGDARLDRGVALSILRKEPGAQCVAVDVSDGLLWKAIEALSEVIRVPVGLLADFEDHFDFISEQVQAYGKGPYLYSLFGGTFGSLDGPELVFVENLANCMQQDDHFILDVTIVKDENHNLDKTKWGDGTKRFFSHGASRHSDYSAEYIFDNFNKLIEVRGAIVDGGIPGTQLMTVYVKQKPFARARRYVMKELIRYFEEAGFDVRSRLIPVEGPYDLGLFCLRKTPSAPSVGSSS